MIALIDYGSGNLRSVSKALEREGADVRLVDSPAGLAGADAMVLPGVGAFGDCVRNLRGRGLWDPVKNWLEGGKPFLGICLGYQLLFESSEETPGEKGFGFFRGKVKRFRDSGLKIPHMGWNTLDCNGHALWRGLPAHPYVFFVHSYFPVPDDDSIVTSRTTYGETFAASVARDNVAAVQFHPEKSQAAGLAILGNFIRSIPSAAKQPAAHLAV
jgi:glutamine amidotransferase